MAELKTKQNDSSVHAFIETIEDEQKRNDSYRLLAMYCEETGEQAKMWGASIIGFGQYRYKSERSSQEGDWMLAGFSPRKAALTLYLTSGLQKDKNLLDSLGPYKQGKGCLYIKRLSDVDEVVLRKLIKTCYLEMRRLNS